MEQLEELRSAADAINSETSALCSQNSERLLKQTSQTTDRKKLNEVRAGYLKHEALKSQKID
jgi:hypothetical protein